MMFARLLGKVYSFLNVDVRVVLGLEIILQCLQAQVILRDSQRRAPCPS